MELDSQTVRYFERVALHAVEVSPSSPCLLFSLAVVADTALALQYVHVLVDLAKSEVKGQQ